MPTNLQPLERVARRVVALLLLHFVIAEPAAAQQLSGRVTQSDGTPAAGVQLVATRAADDAVVARVLTSATGSFRLSPSVPSARVRVRALRIGYRPADLGEFALPASGISGLHLELPDDRFRLTSVNAIATQRCEAVPDAGDALVELFGDVRQALNAIGLSAKAPDVPGARAVMSDVMTDTYGRAVTPTRYRRVAGLAARPFQSLSPDSLRVIGYVTQERDGVVYRAPDSDVLASDAFLEDHCVRFVPAHESRTDWVGIAFEPLRQPRNRIEIRGTFWIDRATRAVRRLEFSYAGLPKALDAHDIGGAVDFDDLPGGLWFESRWELRMARSFVSRRTGQVVVEGVQTVGGEVVDMRRGEQLIFLGNAERAEQLRLLEGDGVERWEENTSASGTGQAPIRLCVDEDPAAPPSTGVYGVVYERRPDRMAGATVTARWKRDMHLVKDEWRWTDHLRTSETDVNGFFRICGVPPGEKYELDVTATDGRVLTVIVRSREAGGDVQVEVMMENARRPANPGLSSAHPDRASDPASRHTHYTGPHQN
jgi:hypothetical protein